MKKISHFFMIFSLVFIVIILIYVRFENAKIVFEAPGGNLDASSDVLSPYDHIKEESIHVFDDRVIIDVLNPVWAKFLDTNSMDPVFDVGSNTIQIIPNETGQIHLGDIISYRSDYADGIIIHRVIKIDEDNEGWYVKLKGDNNILSDPGNIRFDQIKRVTVGIIY